MPKFKNLLQSDQIKDQNPKNSLLIIIFVLTFVFITTSCSSSGPNYPFDSSYESDTDTAAEIEEGRAQIDDIKRKVGEGCYEDLISGVPSEYSRCDDGGSAITRDDFGEWENENEPVDGLSGCPNGCTVQKLGCDIKGNISQSSGEKIYHVPGQEFYSRTNIDSEYGERWFCTESEAEVNGWRKAYN